MNDDMSEGERAELAALRERVYALREDGYDVDISYTGWSVRFGGETVGEGRMRGADGRPGILVLTGTVAAMERAVACGERHREARMDPEEDSAPPFRP